MVALTLVSCAAWGQGNKELLRSVDENFYIKVQLAKSVRIRSLHVGDTVEGTLARDVYSAQGQLFTTGSRVQLSVARTERRRKLPNDHWPWIVKLVTPHHENFPVFQDARVI